MTNLLHLGLDLDGTLADHTREKLRIAQELGFELSESETASEAMSLKMPSDAYKQLQQLLYDTEAVARAVRTADARETLEVLADQGWRFSVISRRIGDASRRSARAWVGAHYSGLIVPERIFFVDTDQEKDIVSKAEGVSAYVDDQVGVLGHLQSVERRILFDPFENWDSTRAPHVTIMRSWAELPGYLAAPEN